MKKAPAAGPSIADAILLCKAAGTGISSFDELILRDMAGWRCFSTARRAKSYEY
jgi:hypothetical protein